MFKCICVPFLLFSIMSCSLFEKESEINVGSNIKFVWEDGLNDDPSYKLKKDSKGFYHYPLYTQSQNTQRLTVYLQENGNAVYTPESGYHHKLGWESNFYWWLLSGDTVAQITKTYFNPFLGQLQYVNLPPLINWKDMLIPTINASSYTDDLTGKANTVIAPIGSMKGDTMTIVVRYYHDTSSKIIKDSVRIVLD